MRSSWNARRHRERPIRLEGVEPLEPRTLLAAVAWDGGGDGTSWHDPLNWDNNQVPTIADDATISVATSPTITFTSTSGTRSVNSLLCDEILNVTGGSLTVAAAMTATGALTVSGGTLTLNSTSSMSGMTVSSGTLAGSGDVTVTGTLSWTGGTMSGAGRTIIAGGGGTLSLLAGGTHQLNREARINGTATWTGGDIQMNGGTFTSNGSFTYNTSSNLNCSSTGGTNLFTNAGTFTKQGAGTASVSSGVTFSNTGTLSVTTGTFSLQGPITQISGTTLTAGTWQVSAGASLSVPTTVVQINAAATVTLDTSTSLVNLAQLTSVAGSLSLTNVTAANAAALLDIGGVLSLFGSHLTVTGSLETLGASMTLGNGSSLTAPMTSTATGSFAISDSHVYASGTWNFDSSAGSQVFGAGMIHILGSLQKNGTGTITIPGGITTDNLGSVVSNQGTLVIGGPVAQSVGGTLTGGEWSAVDPGVLDLSGAGITVNNADLEFHGSSGNIIGLSSIHTNNGTITLDQGSSWPFTPAGGVFTNPGELFISGGGTVTVPATVAFNNTGTSVHVTSGTLVLQGGGSSTGGFEIAAGSALVFNAGSYTFSSTSSFYGAGNLTFAAGTSTVSGPVQITGTLTVSGGTATLNSAASTAAVLVNSATLTLASGATLSIAGAASNSGTVTISGSASSLSVTGGGTHTGDFVLQSGGALTFGGNHTFSASSDITGTGSFDFVSGTSTSSGTVNISGTAAFTGNNESFDHTFHAGAIVIAAGSTVTFAGPTDATTLDDAGTLVLVGPDGTLGILDGGSQTGVLVLQSGAAITLDGSYTLTLTSTVTGAGSFTNLGTLTRSGPGITTFDVGINFSNPGMVDVLAGTLNLNGPVLQVAGDTLVAGTWCGTDPGNLAIAGATIRTIGQSAFVMLGGPNSIFHAIDGLTTNNGWFTIAAGRLFTAPGSFGNAGTLVVGPGSVFTVSGAFTNSGTVSLPGGVLRALGGGTQSGGFVTQPTGRVEFAGNHSIGATVSITGGGDLIFGGGTSTIAGTVAITGTARFDGNNETFSGSFQAGTTIVSSASLVTFNAGVAAGALTLSSGGTMMLATTGAASAASVSNGGTLKLGTRQLTVAGAYAQSAPGQLHADIGGTSQFGKLTVGSSSTVAGGLTIALINGFTPTVANQFDLITGAPVGGSFATVIAPVPAHRKFAPLTPGGAFRVFYTYLADFDNNGVIQPADVAGFVSAWFFSVTSGGLAGDFDLDGHVLPADVAAFVGEWFFDLTNP